MHTCSLQTLRSGQQFLEQPHRSVMAAYACNSIPVSHAESEAYEFLMDTDVVADCSPLMEVP